jgi:DNA-binding transcriptional ArsR family regulator
VDGDVDIAAVAAVIGHPARARMLGALAGGRALPAADLARAAGVAPSTASAHLARLAEAGLVTVECRGRHRFHRLADVRVADAIEGLAAIAPPLPVRSLRESERTAAMRAARSCYDHLAGAVGVAVADALCARGALDLDSLALRDPGPLRALGVDANGLRGGRRPLTRSCLDWSERRPHLAGRLGAAVLDALLESGWLVRRPGGRAIAVTALGREGLGEALGLDVARVAPRALERVALRRVA